MRFIPVNCLRDGMISAKRLIGKNGELLLNYGSVIHTSYIKRIKQLGYTGIYIDDDLSKDIEIVDLINDSLRYATVKSLKNLYISVQNGDTQAMIQKSDEIGALVNDILDNVLSNKNLLINMVDLKIYDDYTYFHSVNVGVLAMLLGTAENLNRNQLYNLGLGSILHDIGKVFIPKEIINKDGKLTDEEFVTIQSHPYKGYEYLKKYFQIPPSSYVGVLDHHERYDGKGYPSGKSSKGISLFGRIITISDVYDALTSNRPYRKALSPSDAIEYIMACNEKNFDPQFVKLFLNRVCPYPVGSTISLSNGATAIVMENYSGYSLRPKIKVIKHDSKDVTPYIINLKDDVMSYNIVVLGMTDQV